MDILNMRARTFYLAWLHHFAQLNICLFKTMQLNIVSSGHLWKNACYYKTTLWRNAAELEAALISVSYSLGVIFLKYNLLFFAFISIESAGIQPQVTECPSAAHESIGFDQNCISAYNEIWNDWWLIADNGREGGRDPETQTFISQS